MKKEFTLIKLMIMVAVIGILAAIAIPELHELIERKNPAKLRERLKTEEVYCIHTDGSKKKGYRFVINNGESQWIDGSGTQWKSTNASGHTGRCE